MDYTEIKAPITGYIGKALVTEGNYVNSTTQNLARIVQTDPIRVAFSVSDKDFLNMREQRISQGSASIKTELVLPNGKVLVNHLKSRFNDNEINSDTATIAVYAEYNNKDSLLIPGNYVDIRLGNKEDKIAILVPQAAVAQDEHGNYVMVVNENNIAEERRVVLGDTAGRPADCSRWSETGRPRHHSGPAESQQRTESSGRRNSERFRNRYRGG